MKIIERSSAGEDGGESSSSEGMIESGYSESRSEDEGRSKDECVKVKKDRDPPEEEYVRSRAMSY